jgi:rhodanese-related sulfurtransferase
MLAIALVCVLMATVVSRTLTPVLAQSVSDEPQVRTIGIDELVDLMKSGNSYVLVDTRPREAYDQAHLPGAIAIPLSNIDSYEGRLDRNSTVVVYSDSFESPVSTEAAAEFMRLGFKDVRDYKGGFQEWKERDYPVYGR